MTTNPKAISMRFSILLALFAALACGSDLGLGPVPTNSTLVAPGPIGSTTPSSGAFTTLSATGAITSTLATGTAPFTVASTTNVPNLNASTLSGKTHADPGPIGSGTASTGAFTTLSATGAITSTLATGTAPFTVASTTNVANLNASSLGGATFAAPGSIGSGTPAAGAFTTLTASGATTFTANTASTGSGSGAVVVTGGVGVGGNVCSPQFVPLSAANAYNTAFDVPCIYGTANGGGAYPFLESGNLVISPRISGAGRDVVISASGSAADFRVDRNANVMNTKGHGFGVTSTATAAGTTTLGTTTTAVQVFTGSTTQTMTLPAANAFGAGIAVTVMVKNVSSGTVTVQRAGSDTINSTASNVTSFTMAQWASCILVSDGVSAWERF